MTLWGFLQPHLQKSEVSLLWPACIPSSSGKEYCPSGWDAWVSMNAPLLTFWTFYFGKFQTYVKGEEYSEPNYQLSQNNYPWIPSLAWFLFGSWSGCLSIRDLSTDAVPWVCGAQSTGLRYQEAADQLAMLCGGEWERTHGGQEWKDQFEERASLINTLDKISSGG